MTVNMRIYKVCQSEARKPGVIRSKTKLVFSETALNQHMETYNCHDAETFMTNYQLECIVDNIFTVSLLDIYRKITNYWNLMSSSSSTTLTLYDLLVPFWGNASAAVGSSPNHIIGIRQAHFTAKQVTFSITLLNNRRQFSRGVKNIFSIKVLK